MVPGAEEAADVDELGDVVGIVVGYKQGLAKNCLAVAPGNFGEQIGLGIGDQVEQSFLIGAELLDAFGPGCVAGRDGSFRPVAFGPFGGDVLGVPAEFDNVPLSDAEVLEEHPGRMRKV